MSNLLSLKFSSRLLIVSSVLHKQYYNNTGLCLLVGWLTIIRNNNEVLKKSGGKQEVESSSIKIIRTFFRVWLLLFVSLYYWTVKSYYFDWVFFVLLYYIYIQFKIIFIALKNERKRSLFLSVLKSRQSSYNKGCKRNKLSELQYKSNELYDDF